MMPDERWGGGRGSKMNRIGRGAAGERSTNNRGNVRIT